MSRELILITYLLELLLSIKHQLLPTLVYKVELYI